MNYITVTQVNNYIKKDLENDENLKRLQVMGEISNFKAHNTGHFYFTLKDDTSRINCVMFQSYTNNVKFKLEDGMKVVVTCSIGVYANAGSYQLYVYNIDPVGMGNLFLQYEELKKKLNEKGYFDESHKRPLPRYPLNIGVISAKEGAAIRDVITTIKRRWPICQITLLPSLVQGVMATSDIVNKLIIADSMNFDTIIVARGGGSIEDLWCFNEEAVALQVYKMRTPIISAVGHETDTTIIDYVSDKRAATPTGAAELATPNIVEVLNNLDSYKQELKHLFNNYLNNLNKDLNNLKNSPVLTNIKNIFIEKNNRINLLKQELLNCKNSLMMIYSNKIENIENSLTNAFINNINAKTNKLKQLEARIDTLSPLKVLSRGYGLITKNDNVISSISNILVDDVLTIDLKDGKVESKVINIIKENKNGN